MDPIEEVQRGQRAKELLENAMLRECLISIRAAIIDKWRNAPLRDREGMHELKLMDKLLTDIEGYIKTVAETGRMAEIQLEQEKRVQKVREAGLRI